MDFFVFCYFVNLSCPMTIKTRGVFNRASRRSPKNSVNPQQQILASALFWTRLRDPPLKKRQCVWQIRKSVLRVTSLSELFRNYVRTVNKERCIAHLLSMFTFSEQCNFMIFDTLLYSNVRKCLGHFHGQNFLRKEHVDTFYNIIWDSFWKRNCL